MPIPGGTVVVGLVQRLPDAVQIRLAVRGPRRPVRRRRLARKGNRPRGDERASGRRSHRDQYATEGFSHVRLSSKQANIVVAVHWKVNILQLTLPARRPSIAAARRHG